MRWTLLFFALAVGLVPPAAAACPPHGDSDSATGAGDASRQVPPGLINSPANLERVSAEAAAAGDGRQVPPGLINSPANLERVSAEGGCGTAS